MYMYTDSVKEEKMDLTYNLVSAIYIYMHIYIYIIRILYESKQELHIQGGSPAEEWGESVRGGR